MHGTFFLSGKHVLLQNSLHESFRNFFESAKFPGIIPRRNLLGISNMQDNELVISDTSPLLNLALIDQLSLLTSQFSGITVPAQVWQELA